MTKNRFLSAYRAALKGAYTWTRDEDKLTKFMDGVANTIKSNNVSIWNASGDAMQKAWKDIGMKGKATLKGLRSLPVD